jgi:circadian clock protein KaiB
MKARKTKKNRRTKPVAVKLPAIVAKEKYVLRLFVAGATARSRQAIMHVRALCATSLKGRVKLEVMDIYQQPGLAHENQIVATPALIIVRPLPVRRFIGNLTTIADLFGRFEMEEKRGIVL